jgi:hypothetical protein
MNSYKCDYCGNTLKTSDSLSKHLKVAKKCLKLRESLSFEKRLVALENDREQLLARVSNTHIGDNNINNNIYVNVYNQKILNMNNVKHAIENSSFEDVKDSTALKQTLASNGLDNESVRCTDAHRGILRYYLDSDISKRVRDIKGGNILKEIFIQMTSDGIHFTDKIRHKLEEEFAKAPDRSMSEFLQDKISFQKWERNWHAGGNDRGEMRDTLLADLCKGEIDPIADV